MRAPARFTSAGEMTGSAPTPCCSARDIASRHRRGVVAKGSIFDAKASSARQATSRYGRPILRARSAPSCRCRSLSRFPSDQASTIPRFMSATARRSLSRAMSSSDCPGIAEGQDPAAPATPGLSMPDGVDDLAVLAKPFGGQPVQDRQFFGQPPAQLKPEQLSEEVVIPEPGSGRIERYDKRARVFEVKQDPFGARVTSQQIRQLTVDPVQQGGTQKQLLDLGRLALQDLWQQLL